MLNNSKIIYHRLNKELNPPLQKKHTDDAGYDLRAMEEIIIGRGESYMMPTGIAFKIPRGHYGQIVA